MSMRGNNNNCSGSGNNNNFPCGGNNSNVSGSGNNNGNFFCGGNNSNNGNSCGGNSGNQDANFVRHLCNFVGETVTIFTTSGGAAGCGFTGVVLSVNACFIRLVTEQGMAPANPLADSICCNMDNGNGNGNGNGGCFGPISNPGRCNGNGNGNGNGRIVGSVVDIPLDKIAAFCHNAV